MKRNQTVSCKQGSRNGKAHDAGRLYCPVMFDHCCGHNAYAVVKRADAENRRSGRKRSGYSLCGNIGNRPLLLIADEPTGNLDPETSRDIMEVFKKINHMGTTVLMVTHDKTLVDMMNKRVIEIDGGKVVRDEQKGGYDDET